MASKYAKKFAVPESFPELLQDLTREILREVTEGRRQGSREDMVRFAHEYMLARLQHRSQRRRPPLSEEQMRERIMQLFRDADVDGNGYLDHREFKAVFSTVSEELGLTDREVRQIFAEADTSGDGVIEYAEFVPVAVDVVRTIYAKMDTADKLAHREQEAAEETQAFMLHGMPRAELEMLITDIFHRADMDGNGTLSRAEFFQCLQDADLGLTRHEVNVLMLEVDENEDGLISYEEFIPVCFDVLVQIVAQDVAQEKVPSEERQVAEFLSDLFVQADVDRRGRLHRSLLRDLLRTAELGLTRIQIHAIMGEAEEDADGSVDYATFARRAATMIASLVDIANEAVRGWRWGWQRRAV